MEITVVRMRVMTLFILLLSAITVWGVPFLGAAGTQQELAVHFFDVGQGDAALIVTPDGVQVLIDGGQHSQVLTQLARTIGPFDRTLDMVIGTHPDSDHVGGLVDVLDRYEVAHLLVTENRGESSVATAYEQAVTNEGAHVTYARRGQEFALGASTTLRVLYPETNPEKMESNASSIVLQLIYGESEFLLTGDAPKRIEEYLTLTEGEALQSDVLKIGHHGSDTSTAIDFLREVDPRFAVISAGTNNRYGHPHTSVTDLLFNERIETYQTALHGTVSFYSDGVRVWKE